MATIEAYTLASGTKRYRVRYRTPTNQSTDKGGFATKKAAQDFAATVEVSKLRGEYVRPVDSRVTMGALGPAWLGREVHLKPSSARPLEIAWRVHVEPRWGDVRLSDVRYTDAQQWIAEPSAERGATTVIRAFGVLAAILDDAVKDRHLSSNPIRGVTLPRKVKRDHVYLTHDQVDALAGQLGTAAHWCWCWPTRAFAGVRLPVCGSVTLICSVAG